MRTFTVSIKASLLNLFNSGGDTSISSDVGNPGWGKTPYALKQQKEIMTTDDNYLRKNFESFFENWAETAINVYFAEREGIEELQLDQKTADRLRELEKEGKLDEGFVNGENIIRINYSSATPSLHFRVNASTSKLNGQVEQLDSLQLLLQIAGTPTLAQLIPTKNLAAAWNKIVANSGVEDPEDLTVDLEDFDKREDAGYTDEEQAIVEVLRGRGVPDEIIENALEAEKNGMPGEEILENIERLMDGR